MFSHDRPALTGHTLTGRAELERELARIVEQDHAISREEAIIGVVGLAVPVRDDHGTVVAAIHVSALGSQMTADEETRLLAAARASAVAIERDLGRLHDDAGPRPPGTRATG